MSVLTVSLRCVCVVAGMQLVKPNFLRKTHALSTVAKNTSCSRGWLRLVVQTIFAIITVTSFILIVIMAISSPNLIVPVPVKPSDKSRCIVQSCRVLCNEVPYYGRYEDEIIYAIAEADTNCKGTHLSLNNPIFENETLPVNWLSRVRGNIKEISIYSGNLKHLQPGAFMSQYSRTIRTLTFHSITIKTWASDSLVGLSNLRALTLMDCNIVSVQTSAVRAVDDTLGTLTISRSGHWDPMYITGSTELMRINTVDFSYNTFQDILGSQSFIGLEHCKVLYLNSCKITALGPGTFDRLRTIEVLYLNDNYLVSIPPKLFYNIITVNPMPRINLQGNMWHCDCELVHLRKLINNNNLLLLDPICATPKELEGYTFTEFEIYCRNGTEEHENIKEMYLKFDETLQINGNYCNDQQHRSAKVRMVTPFLSHRCSINNFRNMDVTVLNTTLGNSYRSSKNNSWLQLTYFFQADSYSVIQLCSSTPRGFGLVWYQSTCPMELNCVNVIPNLLRIYNVHLDAYYRFCPISLSSGFVESDNCVEYTSQAMKQYGINYKTANLYLYMLTALSCLIFGAVFIYYLIRRKPTLLKGSKRILFVKHKNVDALVLPPKVPLRSTFIDEGPGVLNEQKIFTLSPQNKVVPGKINRIKSVRSDQSGTPSYVSALQPTDDQLAEWRVRHHFNNDLTINSTRSEYSSSMSWIFNDTQYHSLNESETTYESLRL